MGGLQCCALYRLEIMYIMYIMYIMGELCEVEIMYIMGVLFEVEIMYNIFKILVLTLEFPDPFLHLW